MTAGLLGTDADSVHSRTWRYTVIHARIGAATGILFSVATIVGNEMSNSGNAPGDSATVALANIRRAHGAVNHAGTALEIVGFIAFAFFAAYLYRCLRRGEGANGWLAGAALITAAADLGVKLGSGASLVAAYAHPADLSASVAGTLTDLNNAAFVITGLTMAGFVLSVSLSAHGSRTLPRTLTWIGLVLGVLGLVTPNAAIMNPNDYNPLPYLLSLFWITAVAIARLVKDGRGGEDDSAPRVLLGAQTSPSGGVPRR
jgi:hypothetical protein